MKGLRFTVDVEAGDYIRVTPPRTATGLFPGETVEIPWAVNIDERVVLSFLEETSLVALRDAITAALAERGGS